MGVLFILAILALTYMVSQLAQEYELGGKVKTYYTLVDDSIGLIAGSSVKVAGIEVGRLINKSLQNDQAKLTFEVVSSVDIHKDATLELQSIGYLGDRYLRLYPGSHFEPVVREGSFVPAHSDATVNKLMNEGEGLLESWTEIARGLRALIGH